MSTVHQNYVNLFYALLFGLLVSISWPIWKGPDLLIRMGFASAMFLLARDVMAGAAIFRGPRKINNPRRWVYAYYHALFFGIFMALFNWRGTEEVTRLLIGTAIGAVLFAATMGFAVKAKDHAYTHHFETEGADTPNKLRKILFFVWPLLTIAIFICLIFSIPSKPLIIVAVAVFVGFLFPLYQRKPLGSFVWTNLPRIAGFAILVMVLLGSLVLTWLETEPVPASSLIDAGPQPIYQELSP